MSVVELNNQSTKRLESWPELLAYFLSVQEVWRLSGRNRTKGRSFVRCSLYSESESLRMTLLRQDYEGQAYIRWIPGRSPE